jgi:ATP-binding cassette subfamily B protein
VWGSAPGWAALQAGVLILQSTVPVLALYLLKAIIDAVSGRIAGATLAPGRITFLIVLAGGIAALGAALRALAALVGEVLTLRVGDRMHELLHAKSVAIDLQYYENPEFHDTLHRAQEDAPTRPARMVFGLAQVGQSALSLLAVTGLLLSFHWLLVVVLVAAGLPGILFKTRHSRKLYGWIQQHTPEHRRARYLNGLLTSMEFAKEIRLFNLGAAFRNRFRELRRLIHRSRLRLVAHRSASDFVAQLVAVAAVSGSIFFISRQALAGAITVGGMVMYLAAFQRAQEFFGQLLGGMASIYEDTLFLADFSRFLDLEPTVLDAPAPRPFPRPLRQGIAFEHVGFRYPGTGADVLKDLSFEIRPGEHVALVGENGSGKTTLVKLLCRLYDPTDGTIRIDGIDLRELRIRELRDELAIVFQDYARYQLTARENIWLGNVALPLDSDRIIEAARRTGADLALSALPEGYDTQLGRQFEGGAELSLGEWQKVALARAFLRESAIIVLDEPTAALDPRAEAAVFDRFHELARGRTALLISHRLSTVRMADRIFVMVGGRIAETGAHDELVERDGVYADLYQTQARHYR